VLSRGFTDVVSCEALAEPSVAGDTIRGMDSVSSRGATSVVLFARVRWLSVDPQRRPAPEDVEPTAASVPVAVAKSHGDPPGLATDWPPDRPKSHQLAGKS
jgi:hypothetical protein